LGYIPAVIALRLATVLMAMALISGCGSNADRGSVAATKLDAKTGAAPPAPANPSTPAPRAQDKLPTVVLEPTGRDPVRVVVEIARTDEERRRGLMYRQNLAPGAGMLFLFPSDEIHSFWMKNTLIPLDMIFIRKDGTVAGVVENAVPKTLTARTVGKESRHVLEVNGGFARAHGIREGTRVSYEHVDLTGYDQ